MTFLRRQLPVYSPIGFGSLVAGVAGAVGLGRPRERLRERLAEYYGTSALLLTDSGTTALRLAILGSLEVAGDAAGTGAGGRGGAGATSGAAVPDVAAAPDAAVRDAVALPAYCCFDVVTAAVGAGARVRLYDVDPETLGPDWPSLEHALAAGDVAAVVAVHLYGIPVDVGRIAGLAGPAGALVIDDAAQGFGGSIDGRPLGALGSLGVLSFGRGKGITGGSGGALLANNAPGRAALAAARDLPARGRRGWAELAKLAAQWLLGRPSVYGLPASLPWLGLGETRYEEPWPPRGIARGPAAAVLANWEASVAEAEARRGNVGVLVDGLGDGFGVPASKVARATPGGLRQSILAGREGDDERWSARVRRSGVEQGYPSLPALPVLSGHPAAEGEWPQASRLSRRLWTIPTHSRSDPRNTIGACLPMNEDIDTR